MNRHKTVSVYMQGEKVGTLAVSAERLILFEYTPEWGLWSTFLSR